MHKSSIFVIHKGKIWFTPVEHDASHECDSMEVDTESTSWFICIWNLTEGFVTKCFTEHKRHKQPHIFKIFKIPLSINDAFISGEICHLHHCTNTTYRISKVCNIGGMWNPFHQTVPVTVSRDTQRWSDQADVNQKELSYDEVNRDWVLI